MGVRAVFKEMTLSDAMLEISLAVYFDSATLKTKEPRLELRFDNGIDQRRFVMHCNAFEIDHKAATAVAYATYIFNLDCLFWDCKWKKCKLWLDVDYEGLLVEKVPIQAEFVDDSQKKYFTLTDREVEIKVAKTIDCRLRQQPSLLSCVCAWIIRIINGLLGILLLPWFVIDVLGIMLLHTENENSKITGSFTKRFIYYVGWRYFGFCRNTRGVTGLKEDTFRLFYQLFSAMHPTKNTILFMSNRRSDLTGNFEFVYQYLKDDPSLKIDFWLNPKQLQEIGVFPLISLARKTARAKVLLVDDFVQYLEIMGVSPKTKIIQLWHACGAFKTFGFTRMGKKGGPRQVTVNHRQYSYALVSSDHIAKYYAEGYGLADRKVLSYGVPRTDIFFSEEYKKNTVRKLYESYPDLQGKKIILFAPTFRGNGKNSAFYEASRFEPNSFIRELPEEYLLIIKHHPFVNLKYKIDEDLKNRVFDFSKESEINDLLFITDVLITDYSSVIYEASLLNIPMLFYAYDLENYIATRDFYSKDFEKFVPGKIARTQKELSQDILDGDFDHEKVEAFAELNFNLRDGRSSERVADFIKNLYKEQ